MTYTVYKHTSPSGKVYIGITSLTPNIRWGNDGRGYHKQEHFYNAIQKYGWDSFQHEILYTGLTKEEACAKEIELIAQYKSNKRGFGYNSTSGGEHYTHSEESKRKISESNRGEKHPFYGKHATDETRKKMSEARKGRRFSEEHRRNLSQSQLNHPKKSKRVAQYTLTDEFVCEYPSSCEASRVTQLSQGHIAECCNGKRRQEGGFKWTYL